MKSFFPILLTPGIISIKNNLFAKSDRTTRGIKLLITVSVLVLFILALHNGTATTLGELFNTVGKNNIHPALLLDLLLRVTLFALTLSAMVHSFSALFIAKDLELILSSPINTSQFLLAKLIEITVESSWMLLLCLTPILAAFGTAYKAHAYWIPISFFSLIPFIILPTACSLILATLFSLLVPAKKAREAAIYSALIMLGLLIIKFQTTEAHHTHLNSNPQELLQLISNTSNYWTNYLPSSWLANTLGELLDPHGIPLQENLFLLWGSALVSILISYLVVKGFYECAYSKSISGGSLRLKSRNTQKVLSVAFSPMGSQNRGLFFKEIKLFSRDFTQTIQLALLLGICVIYIYNFRILKNVDTQKESMKVWWEAFLILCNMVLGGFLTIAVSMRFVFPSVPLEGKTIWILVTAPIEFHSVIRTKILTWYVPIGTIAFIIMISGAFAVNATFPLVLWTGLSGVILAYGIVGISVGLGTYFANFDWDSPNRSVSALGGLCCMFSGVTLVVLNLFPFLTVLLLLTINKFGPVTTYEHFVYILVFSTAIMVIINHLMVSLTTKAAISSLESRRI